MSTLCQAFNHFSATWEHFGKDYYHDSQLIVELDVRFNAHDQPLHNLDP